MSLCRGITSYVGDRSHRATALLLRKSSTTPIDARVTLHSERSRAVCDNVPIREDQDRRNGELGEQFANDDHRGERDRTLDAPFGKGGERADTFGMPAYRRRIP